MRWFYILSLKWSTRSDVAWWWGPQNSGYTSDLDKAGRYSEADVRAHASYYDNGESTRAVPCDEAEKHVQRTVWRDTARNLLAVRPGRVGAVRQEP